MNMMWESWQSTPSEALVERLKTLQRSSAKAKQAWETYCQDSGTKFFDPWRHDAAFLETFFEKLDKGEFGEIPQEPQQAMHPPDELVEKVKLLQRSSPEGKLAWEKYCQSSSTTFFDPSKHDGAFLENFLNALEGGQFGSIEVPDPHSLARGKGKPGPGKGPPEPLEGPDIETHKVFVASLPRSTHEDALRTHFSQFGEVQDVILKYDEFGNFRGFAFVTFVDAKVARTILENYDRNTFQGKWIPCVPVRMRKGFPKGAGKGVPQGGGKKLFIRNLPSDTQEDSLRTWAGQFGEVDSTKLMYDPSDGTFRGFAFVFFKEDGIVARIVDNYNDNTFQGKWIECRVAGPKMEEQGLPSDSKGKDKGKSKGKIWYCDTWDTGWGADWNGTWGADWGGGWDDGYGSAFCGFGDGWNCGKGCTGWGCKGCGKWSGGMLDDGWSSCMMDPGWGSRHSCACGSGLFGDGGMGRPKVEDAWGSWEGCGADINEKGDCIWSEPPEAKRPRISNT